MEATKARLVEERAELRAAVKRGEQRAAMWLAEVEQALYANDRALTEHRAKIRRLRQIAPAGGGEGEDPDDGYPSRAGQLLNRGEQVRDALRGVDDLHHKAAIGDDAALRVDDVIRADRQGGEAAYIAAAAAPAYLSRYRAVASGAVECSRLSPIPEAPRQPPRPERCRLRQRDRLERPR